MTRIYKAKDGQTAMFRDAKSGASDNHANRGMSLEKLLNEMHWLYAAAGRAQITKQYVPCVLVRNGAWAKVTGKSTVDYEGVLAGGKAVAFDAKDCRGTRIELSRLQPHQLEHLGKVHALGGIAFVLVRFEYERCYAIPVSAWYAAETARDMKLPAEDTESGWTADVRASISEKDCPDAWRVETVNWLKSVERW